MLDYFYYIQIEKYFLYVFRNREAKLVIIILLGKCRYGIRSVSVLIKTAKVAVCSGVLLPLILL